MTYLGEPASSAHPRSCFCCAEPISGAKPPPLLPLLAPASAIGHAALKRGGDGRSVRKVIARMLSCP